MKQKHPERKPKNDGSENAYQKPLIFKLAKRERPFGVSGKGVDLAPSEILAEDF